MGAHNLPVQVRDDAGRPVATTTLWKGWASAAWALLLDEIEPDTATQGALVAVPSQDTLIVCAVPEPSVRDRPAAVVAEMARHRVAATGPGNRINDSV